jgi:hypothetical protein
LAYGEINGKEAEQYARETFQKWKSGSTKMSGLVAQRLFNLLPPRMPTSAKLELAGNIWRHFGPSSSHSFTVGPAADVKLVVEAISDKLSAAIQTYQIPDQIRNRFEWLSSGDIRVKEELLNHFRKMEKNLVLSKIHEEVPILQKQIQDYAGQTISVRTKLEIHRNSVEIYVDDRLGDKFREGVPDKRPTASASLSLDRLIIAVIVVIVIFAIMTKHR